MIVHTLGNLERLPVIARRANDRPVLCCLIRNFACMRGSREVTALISPGIAAVRRIEALP